MYGLLELNSRERYSQTEWQEFPLFPAYLNFLEESWSGILGEYMEQISWRNLDPSPRNMETDRSAFANWMILESTFRETAVQGLHLAEKVSRCKSSNAFAGIIKVNERDRLAQARNRFHFKNKRRTPGGWLMVKGKSVFTNKGCHLAARKIINYRLG